MAESQRLQGSFRNVRFISQEHSQAEGRRIDVREHGLADTASIQDLGRKWPVYNLDVFTTASMGGVDGENLRNACIKPGAGRLVHPWLGSFDAYCTTCTINGKANESGMSFFKLAFVPKPQSDGGLIVTMDTAEAVRIAAEFPMVAAINWGVATINLTKPEHRAAFTQESLSLADQINAIHIPSIGGLMKTISREFRNLLPAIANIADIVAAVATVSQTAFRSLQAGLAYVQQANPIDTILSATIGGADAAAIAGVRDLILGHGFKLPLGSKLGRPSFNLNSDARRSQTLRLVQASENNSKALPVATGIAKQNRQSRVLLVQTAALTELAKIGAATEFTSQNATTQWADQILPRFETLIRAAPDELVDGLVGLRNAVLQDLQYRAANLPSTVYYDLKSAASSLFLSQRIYGNADRADEIFARSGAANPLAIPPGNLEVIRG